MAAHLTWNDTIETLGDVATASEKYACIHGPIETLFGPNCSRYLPPEYANLELVYHDDAWTGAVIQRITLTAVIMMFTLIGNLGIIIVLTCSRYRKMNSRVNVFIINLAIGDLTVCCFTMTTEVLFVVFEGAWVMGAAACKILLYVQVITLASTVFILATMSFDRYMAICRPLSFGNTTSRARKMIACAWVMAFMFASPQLLIFKQKATGIYPSGEIKYQCLSKGYTAWWQRKLYFTWMTVYILIVPAIFISFCYINVVQVVWRQGQECRNKNGVSLRRCVSNTSAIPRAKIKTVKMTLSIICTFIMCWTPYFVVHLIHIWSEYKYEIPDWVYVLAESLALWNSAMNPILYGCFNIKLKRGLSDVFCMKKRCTESSTYHSRNGIPTLLADDEEEKHHMRAGCGHDTIHFPRPSTSSSGSCKSNRSKEIIKEENRNGYRLRVRFTPAATKTTTQTVNLLQSDHEKSDDEVDDTMDTNI